jgi:nucleotide-binding universal stress UspA family protein
MVTMALKDILLHLDGSPRSGVRLALASELAQRYQAHLTAVYVIDPPSPALFYGDPSGYVDPRVIEEIMTRLRESAMKLAAPVEETFRDRLRRDALEGEWRFEEGPLPETVALHARYADLAIVGQWNPDEGMKPGAAQVPAATLLSSGRPVLIVPYAGDFAQIGRRVLVAWKSTREAARAVNDAIPILQQANSVTILAVNPEEGGAGEGDLPAADIARHLARHGIKAVAAYTVAKEIAAADAILNYADDTGADLIVAGGYGHSRLREFAFGGVTRDLLTEMTLPVLLSH